VLSTCVRPDNRSGRLDRPPCDRPPLRSIRRSAPHKILCVLMFGRHRHRTAHTEATGSVVVSASRPRGICGGRRAGILRAKPLT
jgi:hypothetical protein